MPERRDSVDSFDDFFGGVASKPQTKPVRAASPVQSEKKSIRTASPVQSETKWNKRSSPVQSETKSIRTSSPIENEKTDRSVFELVRQNPTMEQREKSPDLVSISTVKKKREPIRENSVQSKNYESDFDSENFSESESKSVASEKIKTVRLTSERKTRVTSSRRRGSESDLKSSSMPVERRNKSTKQSSSKGRPPVVFPSIRNNKTRPNFDLTRHRKRDLPSSAPNETEKSNFSSKNEKFKSLESRIAELRRELEEQRIENATLRTIQRREEKAIKKYEEKEYDIHRIVRDYNNEIQYVKRTLSAEREVKTRLEKQIQARDDKLREQTQRLKHFEKIVQEKNLEERFELQQKIKEIDKKLEDYQEKLATQERYIENLEKNHRHELKQELGKQRQLKRELEGKVEKYNELLSKYEEKNRQIDTMHIYAQRVKKPNEESPRPIAKAQSLQSLNETVPRHKEKRVEKKPAPKEKPRRMSSPDSIKEEIAESPTSKTKKTSVFQRDEKQIKQPQIHKRSTTTTKVDDQDNNVTSSVFKLTEPPALSTNANNRKKRDLDEKWSDMFGSTKGDDAAKDNLLAKLVADEQRERRNAATSNKTSSMNTFESSTRAPPAAVKPLDDPFASLFGSSNNNARPTIAKSNDLDDIFAAKPSAPAKSSTKTDTFESLFGNSTSNNNNDRLTRAKAVNNGAKPVVNRTVFDELDELVL